MSKVTEKHFIRAASDIGANGDNDTLPFDIDCRFVRDRRAELTELSMSLFDFVDGKTPRESAKYINSLQIFTERLLVPTGSAGFRITTKIHPFWNLYFNGLGVAIAEKNEPNRSHRAHSYRFSADGPTLFQREKSWRAYKGATLVDERLEGGVGYVVQTDVSSFYEHVYHHRLENCVRDLFPEPSTVPVQVDRFLSKFAAGRSFGLPVGGQCARVLAEVFMTPIDRALSDEGVTCHRYVDDFTLISDSQQSAYRDLSVLSHVLADYGLSLNRTKTTILKANHYIDYVNSQLSDAESDDAGALREIDLYFDPYSDTALENYDELRDAVQDIDVALVLNLELQKAQPDTFLVAQIGRTLRFHSPEIAIQLCKTILDPRNLNSFRASWATIMRGIAAARSEALFESIFRELDLLLDNIPLHASHLLQPEANMLHYLRTIRFKRTDARGQFLRQVYHTTRSETVKRACIECWQQWPDRASFIMLRNQWQTLGAQEQRALWLAAKEFGDDGMKSRSQVRMSLPQAWSLGIERDTQPEFWSVYSAWTESDA